jgi:hypothetical protein
MSQPGKVKVRYPDNVAPFLVERDNCFQTVQPLCKTLHFEISIGVDARDARDILIQRAPKSTVSAITAFSNSLTLFGSMRHPFALELVGFAFHPLCIATTTCASVLPAALTETVFTGTELTKIALGVASGMAAIASLGVVLKTLRPECVFLTDDRLPKLGSFEEAHLVAQAAPPTKRPVSVYDSPEVIGNSRYNGQADVYSYGMFLFWMATQTVPYEKEPAEKMARKIVEGKRPSIPRKVPSSLRDLIQKCWAEDPGQRPTWAQIIGRFLSHSCAFAGTIEKEITLFSQKIIDAEKVHLVPIDAMEVVKKPDVVEDSPSPDEYSNERPQTRPPKRRQPDTPSTSRTRRSEYEYESYEYWYSDPPPKSRTPKPVEPEYYYYYYSESEESLPSKPPPRKLDLRIIADIDDADFESELRIAETDLRPVQYARFFEILSGYFKIRIERSKLVAILRTIGRILTSDAVAEALLESGLPRYLPIDDPALLKYTVRILSCFFKIRANFFDGGFEPMISKVIERDPNEALNLFSLYSIQFALIENPWPMLDRFLKSYTAYFHSEGSAEYARILSFLVWKYPTALASRIRVIREIMERFLECDDTKTIIECYRGLVQVYDENTEIPVKMVALHLRDEEVVADALLMASKPAVLPASSTLVHSLLNVGLTSAKATSILVQSASEPGITAILLQQPKWMKYGLPTWSWTLKLCLRISDNPTAIDQFNQIKETQLMAAKIVKSHEVEAIQKLSEFLWKIDFTKLKELERSGFFEMMHGTLEAAKDRLPFVVLLATLARLGYTPALVNFAELLDAELRTGGEIAHEAIRALSVMSAYPKCAARFRKLHIDDTIAELRWEKKDKRYVRTFMNNMRDVE